MTDNDIKNVYVYPDQFRKVDSQNKHHLRFRIVTEDLSKTSAWSPVYKVSAATIKQVNGSLLNSGDVITFAWGDANARPEYDVFVKWYINGSWDSAYAYHGTTPIHTYSTLVEKRTISSVEYTATKVKFLIQVASYSKERSYTIEVYPRDGGSYTTEFSLV